MPENTLSASSNTSGEIPLIQLAVVERAILDGNWRAAVDEFVVLLGLIAKISPNATPHRKEVAGELLFYGGEVAERAIRAWNQILSNRALKMLDMQMLRVVRHMDTLHTLQQATMAGNMDDFIAALHTTINGNYQAEDFVRLLLAWGPGSQHGIDIWGLAQNAPEMVVGQALATISDVALVNEKGEAARTGAIELLASGTVSEEALVNLQLPAVLLTCYMRCSYAASPKRHEVKRYLNNSLLRTIEPLIPEKTPPGDPSRSKPVMLCPLEAFGSKHAMYRCYAHALEACRDRFHMVGICAGGSYDDATKQLFDEFYDAAEFSLDESGDPNIKKLLDFVCELNPDIVFYPSVGMTLWTTLIANVRLAPVQAMSLGHPATSMIECMDYVVTEEQWLPNPERFSETPVLLPEGALRYALPPTATRVQPDLDHKPRDVIRIAVPSVSQKLNRPFIELLQRLEGRFPRQVKFCFFIGAGALEFSRSTFQIKRELKNSECFPMLDYDDYIFELNRCHLHLATWPFGGTNSVIDSLRQGLPVFSIEGEEPQERVDANFASRIGLREQLVFDSVEALEGALVAYIEEPEKLYELSRHILTEVDVDAIFLEEGQPDAMAEALSGLVKKHHGSSVTASNKPRV